MKQVKKVKGNYIVSDESVSNIAKLLLGGLRSMSLNMCHTLPNYIVSQCYANLRFSVLTLDFFSPISCFQIVILVLFEKTGTIHDPSKLCPFATPRGALLAAASSAVLVFFDNLLQFQQCKVQLLPMLAHFTFFFLFL